MRRQIIEPLAVRWIWLLFLVFYLFAVPWMFPTGSYKPIIMGFPYWAFVVLLASLGIASLTSFTILRYWNLEELLEDESAKEEGGAKK